MGLRGGWEMWKRTNNAFRGLRFLLGVGEGWGLGWGAGEMRHLHDCVQVTAGYLDQRRGLGWNRIWELLWMTKFCQLASFFFFFQLTILIPVSFMSAFIFYILWKIRHSPLLLKSVIVNKSSPIFFFFFFFFLVFCLFRAALAAYGGSRLGV